MTTSQNTGTKTATSADAAENVSRLPRLAGTSLRAWLCFLLVAGIGLTLDLTSKEAAFAHLGYGYNSAVYEIIPGILELRTTLNGGAVFGIGRGLSILFIMVSLLAMVFIVYVFICSDRRHWLMHIALGLILAGAAGNLYDRVFNHGLVRDFIYIMHYWPWIFNLADAMLCIGVPLLILCWLVQSPRQVATKPEKSG